MSVNSSSVFNNSLPQSALSVISSSLTFYMFCLRSEPTSFIYTTFSTISTLLLIPLCCFILHHGLQQRASSSSSAATSHSDCFTYHIAVMELIGCLGFTLCIIGIYTDESELMNVGLLLIFYLWSGEMFFHMLTCVERYLAVVHPITYLNLRNERGVRIRNIIIASVWLLSFMGIALVMFNVSDFIFSFSLLILCLVVISFCSVSVLSVLLRPGPGGQESNRVDQTKQRAFHTITAISAVLLVRFVWGVVWFLLYLRKEDRHCITVVFDFWFVTPSSLVLPLLYLHRAGKLKCCCSHCFIKR